MKRTFTGGFAIAVLVACGLIFYFRHHENTPHADPAVTLPSPSARAVAAQRPFRKEANALEARLNRAFAARLDAEPDHQREAAITEFREDFAAELARSAEIEAELLDPATHPELLRPEPAFVEQRGHILAVADLIRAGHPVEEAEALVAKRAASPDATEEVSPEN